MYHQGRTRKSWSSRADVTFGIHRTGVYGWIIEEMCPYSRRGIDHREMPYCSVWRPLWSFQNTSKNLAKWFLLAHNVWRHQRFYSKVPKMPVAGRHHCSQCNAPHIQSPSWTVQCLGYWLHGAIPKVPWLRVYPGYCGLHLQIGRDITLSSCRCQACEEDVSWNHLPSFRNTKDGYKW